METYENVIKHKTLLPFVSVYLKLTLFYGRTEKALVRIRWQETEIKSPSQMKPLSEYLRQLGKMILQIQNVMVYIKPKFNIK